MYHSTPPTPLSPNREQESAVSLAVSALFRPPCAADRPNRLFVSSLRLVSVAAYPTIRAATRRDSPHGPIKQSTGRPSNQTPFAACDTDVIPSILNTSCRSSNLRRERDVFAIYSLSAVPDSWSFGSFLFCLQLNKQTSKFFRKVCPLPRIMKLPSPSEVWGFARLDVNKPYLHGVLDADLS